MAKNDFEQPHWHDFTQAVSKGLSLDWSSLEGRRVKLENEDGLMIIGDLTRDHLFSVDKPAGWKLNNCNFVVMDSAWWGENGWSMSMWGEIYLKNTAQYLPLGHYFKAKDGFHYLVVAKGMVQKLDSNIPLLRDASEVEVAKDLGKYVEDEKPF